MHKLSLRNIKKYSILGALLLINLFILTSCGKPNETEVYQEQMNNFYSIITTTSVSINNIDAQSENAPNELLNYLDIINSAVASINSISVPEEYSQNNLLTQYAATEMSNAVSLYHEAFSASPFDSEKATEAEFHYKTAMNYIEYLGQSLMGYEIEMEAN